jgi:hypothetical protein
MMDDVHTEHDVCYSEHPEMVDYTLASELHRMNYRLVPHARHRDIAREILAAADSTAAATDGGGGGGAAGEAAGEAAEEVAGGGGGSVEGGVDGDAARSAAATPPLPPVEVGGGDAVQGGGDAVQAGDLVLCKAEQIREYYRLVQDRLQEEEEGEGAGDEGGEEGDTMSTKERGEKATKHRAEKYSSLDDTINEMGNGGKASRVVDEVASSDLMWRMANQSLFANLLQEIWK